MLAIIFLVPGLIMKNMLRVLARYEPTSRKVELLECLTASCFNYLIGAFFVWYLLHVWPDGLDLRRPETVPHHAGYLFLWAAIVLVLPAILGLILGVAARKLSLRNFLSRFGVSILHPAPTAW
ncbi:MAG: hypothetical protein KGY81_04100, partial [Phycisphaerae bacterium]|nr:hypothetical protein [Phycisphaerae bacterium]